MKREIAHRLAKALHEVAHARGLEGALPEPTIDRPKKPEHGDFATNVALMMAKGAGARELANQIKAVLERDPTFSKVEVAGPGFINLKLAPRAFHAMLSEILAAGRTFGHAPAATGERINLEFVSANPTGPMHLGHARGAVVGDVIGRLLETSGHRVVREYYVNDFGNQIKLLSDSVRAIANGKPVPEGGYGGGYVHRLADWAKARKWLERDDLGGPIVTAMMSGYGTEGGVRGTLHLLGIEFDVYSSEGALHRDGRVAEAVRTLGDKSLLETRDGADFFLSTKFGDDKDRVVYKSDGGHTYFASDIAYHKDKLDRGFERLIDIWGADHHGYIPRVRAAIEALGLSKERFEVILVQMVNLLKGGEPYKMSKRSGEFLTIDEVMDEIDEGAGRKGAGRDALRYFFTCRSSNAHLDIDVDVAKKQSLDNPVYYLQYGHARLSSILRKAQDECALDATKLETDEESLAALVHPDELAIVALLSEFPSVVSEAAAAREPHRVVSYLNTLAQTFQSYYTRLKKEGDTILPRSGERADGSWRTRDGGAFGAKVRARLAWVRAIREVYAEGLALLGISAPDRLERPALPSSAADAVEGEEDA